MKLAEQWLRKYAEDCMRDLQTTMMRFLFRDHHLNQRKKSPEVDVIYKHMRHLLDNSCCQDCHAPFDQWEHCPAAGCICRDQILKSAITTCKQTQEHPKTDQGIT